MASVTLTRHPAFPEGTSVAAYKVSALLNGRVNPDAAPDGTAVDTQTVTNNSVTLSNLDPGVPPRSAASIVTSGSLPVKIRRRVPSDGITRQAVPLRAYQALRSAVLEAHSPSERASNPAAPATVLGCPERWKVLIV
jgi:hypothetical protein